MSPKSRKRTQAPASEPAASGAAPAADAASPPERALSEVDHLLMQLARPAGGGDAPAADDGEVAAEPDPHATYWTELDLFCKDCHIVHYVPICVFLNAAESPHLVERLLKGQFNFKRCPVCRKIEHVEHPFTYYDPARKLAVQVRPEWEWQAGGGEEWYAARLEDFFERWAAYDVRIDVVFGPQQLIDRYLQPAPATPASPEPVGD